MGVREARLRTLVFTSKFKNLEVSDFAAATDIHSSQFLKLSAASVSRKNYPHFYFTRSKVLIKRPGRTNWGTYEVQIVSDREFQRY